MLTSLFLPAFLVGAPEGLDEATNTPPSVTPDTKQDVAKETQDSAAGLHASGKDAGEASTDGVAPKVKTEKECKSHLYSQNLTCNR